MLNITSIEDALYNWINEVVDDSRWAIIFAHQNKPLPNKPLILINILEIIPRGIAEPEYTLQPDDSTDIDWSNLEELFISINVFKDMTTDPAITNLTMTTKLKDSLNRVTITDALYASGLGYNRASEIRDIPEEINKEWESRSQFDCYFFVRSLDNENIATIQKIEITNNINDDGDTVIIEKP